ncbi:MAG: nicotinate-nucleotide adenylyltransferase [Rhodospirillaceae bacterium]
MKSLPPGKRTLKAPAGRVRRVPVPVPDGRRIGLLGGSFNPAHGGHLDISRLALELLDLDEIWWLVSPQNPLKAADGMAALTDRVDAATRVADGHPIVVTDVEADMGTRFTADTLVALQARYPGARFVWLMGADNLCQVHKWRDWSRIFHTVPVAVFARPTYSLRAEQSKAARRFARYRVKPYRAAGLATRRAPAWVLFKRPHNPVSATKIRESRSAPAAAGTR